MGLEPCLTIAKHLITVIYYFVNLTIIDYYY